MTAFQVSDIAFLDTPGRAAFASMRNSSKAATNVLILVVDCQEGTQEKTNEIINLCLNNDDNSNNDVKETETLIVEMTRIDQIVDTSDDETMLKNMMIKSHKNISVT